MQSMHHKIVLVTGATSGIGRACAAQFAQRGADIIIIGRRPERLAEVANELRQQHVVKVLPVVLDVRDEQAVNQAIHNLPQEWQAIDILVNNAGLAVGVDKVQDANTEDWSTMIDTNIKGVLYLTKAVLPGMLARNRGHIINIGSISSHIVYSGGTVYCATKHAIRAISEGIKMDVHGSAIRVTEVDPGLVNTEFSTVRFHGDQQRADNVYANMTPLVAEDVADVVVFTATRRPHVNIREVKVYPTDQTAAHMVHRRA